MHQIFYYSNRKRTKHYLQYTYITNIEVSRIGQKTPLKDFLNPFPSFSASYFSFSFLGTSMAMYYNINSKFIFEL